MPALVSNWIGQKLGGSPYQVIRHLQTGGMAVVYLGRDLHNGGRVVIKTPQPNSTDETLPARFESEVRALRSLAHAHVVPILDAGEFDGIPFLVLPYLEGGSLLDRLRKEPAPRDPASTWRWLPDIAEALDFLHARGWIHRDVKPANILFDERSKAYLADLGLTKSYSGPVRRALTRLGTPSPGTPRYMAPELLTGEVADGRADQFSLAVLLYEMFTDLAPFAGDNPTAVLRNQGRVRPTPLHELRPDLPPESCAAIGRALALRPTERFPTCAEFVEDFLRAIGQQEASAGNADASLAPMPSDPLTWSLPEHLVPFEPDAPATPSPVFSPTLAGANALPIAHEPIVCELVDSEPPRRKGRWRKRALVAGLWVGLGIWIGCVFVSGTGLHRFVAEPTVRWLDDRFGIKLSRGPDGASTQTKTLEERVETLTAGLALAAERAESEDERAGKLKAEADALRAEVRRAEEKRDAYRVERDREKARNDAVARQLPELEARLDGVQEVLRKASTVHEEIDARVLFINNTCRRLHFKLRGQFWDESWSDWQEHSLAAGARGVFTVHRAFWLRVQVDGSDEYEDLRPQIFLHGKDATNVDVHYEFAARDGRVSVTRLSRGKN